MRVTPQLSQHDPHPWEETAEAMWDAQMELQAPGPPGYRGHLGNEPENRRPFICLSVSLSLKYKE